MDDAFRQQLDVKEQNHARALRTLQQQAHDDVAASNKRVSAGPGHTHYHVSKVAASGISRVSHPDPGLYCDVYPPDPVKCD